MSAVDQCTRVLEGSILRGDPPPGGRLPPERELATTLGVGRATVRDALGRLAVRGLVEVRQGSGYAVRDYRRAGGLDLLPAVASLADTSGERTLAMELLRLRRHLAAAVVEALAERSSPDLAPASEAVDAFEVAFDEEPQGLAVRDLAVVGALVEASGSLPLQLCFNSLHQVLEAMPRLRAAIYAEPRGNVAAYRALLRALESRAPADGGALQQLMRLRDEATLAALTPEA